MSIKDFAEKFIKAWQQALLNGKISDFKMLFDRSFVYHDAEIEASLEAYIQHIADLRKNSDINQVDIKYLTGEGNLFAIDFKAHFNFTSDMPDMPLTKGKEIASHYLCLLHIKNGKVNEGWSKGTITGLT